MIQYRETETCVLNILGTRKLIWYQSEMSGDDLLEMSLKHERCARLYSEIY